MHDHTAIAMMAVVLLAAVPVRADDGASAAAEPPFALAPSGSVPSVAFGTPGSAFSLLSSPATRTGGMEAAIRSLDGLDAGPRLRCRPSSEGVDLRLKAHDDFVALVESMGEQNDYVSRGVALSPCE